MVRRSKRKFAMSNRVLYTLITIGILAVIGVGVYALGAVPNPGHPLSQLQACSNGQILQTNSSGVWDCVAMPTQSSSFPSGLTWGANSNSLNTDQGGSIELGAGNNIANAAGNMPFIDFHYGTGSAQDYNTRIINSANGLLAIEGGSLMVDAGGKFYGDGSGLTNLKVRISGADPTCDSSNDGLLRYKSSYCSSNLGYRSSTFDICMRTGASSYSWYSLKNYTWSDASCNIYGCPSGQYYFQCTNPTGSPSGCYTTEPPNCYCTGTEQPPCPY